MYDQEIPNLKNQITNNFPKSMNPISKHVCISLVWNLKSGFWNLFVFWTLLIGISFQNSHLIGKI